MNKKRVLTGVTTTGIPHLGNYVGAIKPAIAASAQGDTESFFFLADYHGLIKCHDPQAIHASTLAVAATWLACGLDAQRVTFYRQSDVPEIQELNWILTCITPKGLMNRAHAYKAAVQENTQKNLDDEDHQIEMGLYCYPILMAADILMFNAQDVPVGRDQIQHLEMTRDIAQRFNHRFEEIFTLPQALVADEAVLMGLDGRKMSKSYGNTIALFDDAKKLQKSINKIITNLKEPGEAKDTHDSALFAIYRAFATSEQTKQMAKAFAEGIGWGQAKKELFELIDAELAPFRERYNELMAQPEQIEAVLQAGAARARVEARSRLNAVREAVGIRALA